MATDVHQLIPAFEREHQAKLKAYGIAPHDHAVVKQALVPLMSSVRRTPLPYCGSLNTERKSEFGSTVCKAIH
jgi:ring-1,2-phenylacetyl-CoA epoxidase subunit PaaD